MARRVPLSRSLALLTGVVAMVAALAFAGPASAHDRGASHGEPAGKVASFDPESGTLTIELSGGGTETGIVTDQTWIGSSEGCGGGHSGWSHGQSGWSRGHFERRNLHGHFHGRWGGHHGDWHHGAGASTEDLVPGAVVEDAVLVLHDGQAWFAKIDLESTEASSGSPEMPSPSGS